MLQGSLQRVFACFKFRYARRHFSSKRDIKREVNFIIRKRQVLFFCIIILLSSALTYNYQAGASIDQLQINDVPSFAGQMEGSAFTRNGTLFAGDTNFNLFRSDNYGASFRLVYSFPQQSGTQSQITGYVWTIFVDSRNYVFVSIPGTNRLYRSTNFGQTFNEVQNTGGAQNDGFYIGMTEDSQGSLYAATYSNSITPQSPPVLKSTNGGASWSVIHRFAAVHLHNVKFNPANGYLYVSTGEWAPGINSQECERVFRSKDLGQTWTTVINRPAEIQDIGSTVYLPMLFSGNWVYLGTDQAFQPNWIDRFYDGGSNNAYTPQRVYTFPSGSNFPVLSAVWLNNIMLFASTSEFYDGTSTLVASQDGANWQIIKSTAIPQSLHHTNMLTINPMGVVFGSDGPGRTFSIVENTPPPTPTPTPTASPTPTPTPTSTPSPTATPTPTSSPTPTPTPTQPPNGYTLTVTVYGGGTTNPPSGVNVYAPNTIVTQTATPSAGYRFDRWELQDQTTNYGASYNNPEWLTMNRNFNVQAYFVSTSPNPSPTPSPTPTPTPSPGYLFTADFETGSFSQYSGVNGAGTYTATVETNNPYQGSYNAKFTAGTDSEGWAYHSIASSGTTYYHQLIKLNTLPSPGKYLYLGSIQYTNSYNTMDPFIYNSNGQYYWGTISVINGAAYWDMEATPSNPQTGVYYHVEFCRDVTNHRSTLWIDGTVKVDAARSHSGNSNLICTGISWAEMPATIYVDSVKVKVSYIGG